MNLMLDKLKILADSAKYDVSCSSSGVGRRNREFAIHGRRTEDVFPF